MGFSFIDEQYKCKAAWEINNSLYENATGVKHIALDPELT